MVMKKPKHAGVIFIISIMFMIFLNPLFSPPAADDEGRPESVKPEAEEKEKEPGYKEVKWIPYEQALAEAKKRGLPVVLVFYKEDCRKCEILEKKGFNRPDIADYVNRRFAAVKINGDKERELRKKYKVNVFPTVWFLTPEAKEIDSILGYVDPDRLFIILMYIGEGEYKRISYAEYEKSRKK